MLNMFHKSRIDGAKVQSKPWFTLFGCLLAAAALTGCQTTVGGQTLPSAYYLGDDVQFFPAGPEFVLTKQVEALDEYRLEQQALQEGL